MMNYKGEYQDDSFEEKYFCPRTGAHFEFMDLSQQILAIDQVRKSGIGFHKILEYSSEAETISKLLN